MWRRDASRLHNKMHRVSTIKCIAAPPVLHPGWIQIEKQSIKYRIILKQSRSVTGYVPNIMRGDSNGKRKNLNQSPGMTHQVQPVTGIVYIRLKVFIAQRRMLK